VEDLFWFRAITSGVVSMSCSRSVFAPSLISLAAFERPSSGDSKLPGLTEKLQGNRSGKPPFQLKGLVSSRWPQQVLACTEYHSAAGRVGAATITASPNFVL
jgi:hypothetical protein